MVLNKLTEILSYIRTGSRSHRKRKKKKDHKHNSGSGSGKPTAARKPQELTEDVKAAADVDIFADAGDYKPREKG